MKQYTLFYSWQSDDKESKRIIQKALNKAVDSLKKEGIEIYIDQDTRDRTGSANINRRVLEKIESCDIFVADLTPVYTLPKNEEVDSLPKHMLEKTRACDPSRRGRVDPR